MLVPITCACGSWLKAPAYLAGKRVRCEDCGRAVQVPHPLPEFVDLGLVMDVGTLEVKATRDPVVDWLDRIAGVEPSERERKGDTPNIDVY